jgi:hypothetical protein
MSTYRKKITILAAAIAVFSFSLDNASSKIVTNVEADISGEELKALVIEDFEKGEVSKELTGNGWFVKTTPKEFTSESTEQKLKMKNPVPVLEMKFIPGSPNDMKVEEWSLTDKGKKKERCLGVRFKFRYPGHNSVHVMVPKEVDWKSGDPVTTYNPSTRKDEQERGIQLPGQAKAISLWVHGRGNPYDLELWLKDYRGDTHILKFGSVNFVGWRPLKVYIPKNIPQSYESYPQTRVTKITRLVLRSQIERHAEELTEDTFFFFDQLKVLTDTYEVNFDGSDLHKVFEGKGASSGGSSAGTETQQQ